MNRGGTSNRGPRLHAGAEVLALAARALDAVRKGRSADDALAPYETHADRRAIRAIALGAMRWCLRLEPMVLPLLAGPPEATPDALRALLLVAAHQLEYSRNPRESTVSASVDAARGMGMQRAAGLVNAVLRRYLREQAELAALADTSLATRTAHPAWLVAALEADWPEDAVAILEANNRHPPLTLRVDLARGSVEDTRAECARQELPSHALDWLPGALVIDRPVSVAKLPGFAGGQVSVQDAGAQFAARLLAPRAGERVLDACAAPGGKTGALLELLGAPVTAIDLSDERLRALRENLARTGREAEVLVVDLTATEDALGTREFDAILLDAPCSATGVIRRHPDIKLLRRAGDIARLAETQLAILSRCFAHLAPGGRLLYTTCSVLEAENAAVIGRFLAAEPAARELALEGPALPEWRPRAHGAQLLPGGQANADGFYYACLRRVAGS